MGRQKEKGGTASSKDKSSSKKEAMKRRRSAKNRRRTQMKIRVKLPPIEAYEREVAFKAEGPGRVVVRLERLMGTDKIRLTDPKFMTILLERLEKEEHIDWIRRSKRRVKMEKNRSRQLAIEGLMEPTEDMQDLKKHPVFRVNRVLKHLQQVDSNFSHGQEVNLPPIVPVEPFEFDYSGSIFKGYPGHKTVPLTAYTKGDEEEEDQDETQTTKYDYGEGESAHVTETEASDATKIPDYDEDEEREDGEEVGVVSGDVEEEDSSGEEATGKKPSVASQAPRSSLEKLQMKYGLPSRLGEDLNKFEVQRSDLVDMLFVDEENIDEIYEMASKILDVYAREQMKMDKFVAELNRKLHKQ